MIIDNLSTTHCEYGNMDGKLARAFEWLKAHDLASIEPGQVIQIDGSRIKAQIQSYFTIPHEESFFEAHRSYIDIQIMVKGCEIMYWSPLARLTEITAPYDFEKDLIKFADPAFAVPIRVEEGNFCVFFPTDGHKPKCQAHDEPDKVGKIVMKVAV